MTGELERRLAAAEGNLRAIYAMLAILATGPLVSLLLLFMRGAAFGIVLVVAQTLLVTGVFVAALSNLSTVPRHANPWDAPVPGPARSPDRPTAESASKVHGQDPSPPPKAKRAKKAKARSAPRKT